MVGIACAKASDVAKLKTPRATACSYEVRGGDDRSEEVTPACQHVLGHRNGHYEGFELGLCPRVHSSRKSGVRGGTMEAGGSEAAGVAL